MGKELAAREEIGLWERGAVADRKDEGGNSCELVAEVVGSRSRSGGWEAIEGDVWRSNGRICSTVCDRIRNEHELTSHETDRGQQIVAGEWAMRIKPVAAIAFFIC